MWKKFNHFFALGLFALISVLLILSWFRDGKIYGGGDVGLQTYNPKRILENARYVWWDSTAPGSPIPQGLSAIPFQFILFLFQSLGFSPLLLQATLFFIILLLAGFGMYLFLAEKLEDKGKFYPIIGGIFYMFNPYMMIQVWHRFIHTTIVLAGVLPFLAIFWDKWIKEGSLKNFVFFLITNFLAVYIFGTYAYIVTVWIFLLLLTIFHLIPWEGGKKSFKIAARFVFGLIIWLLINCWYLYPVTKISPAVLSEQHRSGESVITLINISAQAILPYTLQLINPFYLFEQVELGSIYKNVLFQALPWVFVATILIGLLHSFKRRNFSIFGIFYLISIFLAKGAAPPFGAAYISGFKNIFALGVLRNPFEKTGLILVFFASVLFVLGLQSISDKTKARNYFLTGLITASVLLFAWPMFLGKIIGRVDKPAYVEVPSSYKLADQWLNNQKNSGILEGKILHLPLTRGESVQYKWEYGYNGLEPSDTFFTSYPSISRGFNIQRVDDSLTALSLIFHKPYHEDGGKILQLLQNFNVRFIVLHKDLNWLGTDTYDPSETENVLSSLNFIEKKAEFGNLIIYQVFDKFFGPKIEIRENISLIYPQNVNMRVWPWLAGQDKSFVSPIQGHEVDESIKTRVKETLIFPENSFSYPQASGSALDATAKQLSVQLGNIAGAVSYLKQLGVIQTHTEETVQNIILSSNKLIQIYQMPAAQTLTLPALIDEYSNLMDRIFPQLDDNSALYFDIGKTTIGDILKFHEVILSFIQKKSNDSERIKVLELQDEVKQFLKKQNLLPHFSTEGKITEVGQRQIYDFWVNSDGKYEMLMTDAKIKEMYADKLNKVDFQINDRVQTLSGKDNGNIISFGNIDLKQGLNEISFSNPPSVNLIQTQSDTIEMKVSKNNPAAIETPVFSVLGEDVYQISLDAQIPQNVAFYIRVIQDTDEEKDGQKNPRISLLQQLSQSNWQGTINLKLPPLSLPTREAKFQLVAVLVNTSPIDSISTVSLKNLKIIRLLTNGIVLRSENVDNGEKSSDLEQKINFKRVSPVQYEGDLKLTKAGFIFFKEAFHQGWKLQLNKGNEVIMPDKHYLGYLYGNAWFIEEGGEYKFKIIFEEQKSFSMGILLTGLGFAIVAGYSIFGKNLKIK